MEKADSSKISSYLLRYCNEYKSEYGRLTEDHPNGGGFPRLPISPYVNGSDLICLVLPDGVVIYDGVSEPNYQWWIAGGPALKVDYEPTLTPSEVTDLLKKEGIYGKNIGISRIVSKTTLTDEIWKGQLGEPLTRTTLRISENQNINILTHGINLKEAVKRLTFGSFGDVLNIHLPDEKSDFWHPHIIRNLGFFPADLNNKKFYNYLEFSPHIEISAWDPRSIAVRVKADVRRDFASYLANKQGGGRISFGADHTIEDDWSKKFTSVLIKFKDVIEGFENILRYQNDAHEAVFHKYIEDNPILLDVYGECKSKPQFRYPNGKKSPIGKTYVEPDFVVSYSNESYKLVELERANKTMATKQGHPKQDFNQAAFQTGEWLHYIKNHYQEIKDEYPGISSKCTTSVIMSRSHESSFGGYKELKSYIELMKETSSVDEILTYDDLLERAKAAYAKLTSLEIG